MVAWLRRRPPAPTGGRRHLWRRPRPSVQTVRGSDPSSEAVLPLDRTTRAVLGLVEAVENHRFCRSTRISRVESATNNSMFHNVSRWIPKLRTRTKTRFCPQFCSPCPQPRRGYPQSRPPRALESDATTGANLWQGTPSTMGCQPSPIRPRRRSADASHRLCEGATCSRQGFIRRLRRGHSGSGMPWARTWSTVYVGSR